MARTISQAQRVEGERGQAAATAQQSVVDRQYRLQAADLGGLHSHPRLLTIRMVGMQGIEQPSPLLHFTGFAKPLRLDAANVAAVARIAGSPLQRDWAGKSVVLAVVAAEGAPVLHIFAPDDPALIALRRKSRQAERARLSRAYLRRAAQIVWMLLGLSAALLVAFSLFQNWALLLTAVQSLMESVRNAL